jgi:transposase
VGHGCFENGTKEKKVEQWAGNRNLASFEMEQRANGSGLSSETLSLPGGGGLEGGLEEADLASGNLRQDGGVYDCQTETEASATESEEGSESPGPPARKRRKCQRHTTEKRSVAIDMVCNQAFPYRKVSTTLKVPLGTLHRWIEEFLLLGKTAPDAKGGAVSGGKKKKMTSELMERVIAFVSRKTTYTLSELADLLAQDCPNAAIPSPSTIGKHLIRAGYTYKCVTIVPCDRNKPEVIETRMQFALKWMERDEEFKQAIFLDECGWTLARRRNRGRAILGYRAYVVLPGNRGANITLFAAVSAVKGLINHQTWLGGTKADTFISALSKMFEALKAQDAAHYAAMHGGAAPADPAAAHVPRLIIMDNCPIHKTQAVRKCIADAGHEVLYEPPWSPFLNPIEEAFAIWKKQVNTKLTKDKNTLSIVDCINQSAAAVTAEKMMSFWKHSKLFLAKCVQGKPIGADAIPSAEQDAFEIIWKFAQEEAAAYRAVHPARKRGRPVRITIGRTPAPAGPSDTAALAEQPAAAEANDDEDVYLE